MHFIQAETVPGRHRHLCKAGVLRKPQWISARFRFGDKTLSLSISLHHLDYHDGISVYIQTKFGNKDLRSEVRKYSTTEVPAYGYGVPEVNAQFDRIIKDMKLYFEKYMLV